VLAVVLSWAAPAGAARRCTKMGCTDALTIHLRTADGQAPADLVIELDLDGRPVTCKAPPIGGGGTIPCEGGDGEEITRTREEIRICGAAGCRGTGATEEVLEIAATPRRVRVRLRQGDRPVAEKTFAPSYVVRRPNGPGCPPLCRQATRTWRYR
jgi:hypothetical protein